MMQLRQYLSKLENILHSLFDEHTWERIKQFLDWFERKVSIHFQKRSPSIVLSKWSVVYVELGMNIWSEIFKTRPCIVVSSSIFNKGNTLLIAPITWLYNDLNQKPKKTSSHQYLVINPDDINNLHKPSIINLGQMRCISKKRIWNKIGRLSEVHISRLNKKLKKFFWL